MRIAIEGCCHGELDAIYGAIADRERRFGYKVDLLLICGDFQSIRNEADLETISCPRKYLQLGTFHKYYSGERQVPVPTIFIGGNHESSNYLWELYHGGWACPGIYFLGYGGVINVGGMRIGGMSGIYKSHDYEKGHFEVSPYDERGKKSCYHIRKYDVYKMLQVREPMDVFLSHDWPLGIEQYGDTRGLINKKKFFAKEIASNTLGSLAFEHVLASLKPARWFSAHLHVRFTAEVPWAPPVPSSSTSPAVAPAPIPTPVAVQNPDEIEIAFDDDDDDDDEDECKNTPMGSVATADPVPAVANPDEIAIDFDDDEDDETGDDNTLDKKSHPTQSNQQPSTISTTVPSTVKPHPRSTQFLALDKCEPHRSFLEIIELPEFELNGPMEFQYDEEWLAIIRTLDSYLTLDYRQASPMQGDALAHAIKVNREWVRNNVTLKQGLKIPMNFQKTSPAHDPVRTLSSQEKHNLLTPFLNPQTEEFCELLKIPNKINPNGRRA